MASLLPERVRSASAQLSEPFVAKRSCYCYRSVDPIAWVARSTLHRRSSVARSSALPVERRGAQAGDGNRSAKESDYFAVGRYCESLRRLNLRPRLLD